MELINIVNSILSHPAITVWGKISGTVALLAGLVAYFWKFRAVLPVVKRMSNSLWKRKIAIIGSADAYLTLKVSVTESQLFTEDNLIQVPLTNLEIAKVQTFLLVDWESAGQHIDDLIRYRKSGNTPILIFAKHRAIPDDKMTEIVDKPNVVIVNAKGRMINDIFCLMMTTGYE